jgi:hypothetical protein
MTYMVAYFLGMLVKYYPTHWFTLLQGGRGDEMWPTLNRAHRLVQECFPEMVAEFIEDVLAHPLQSL